MVHIDCLFILYFLYQIKSIFHQSISDCHLFLQIQIRKTNTISISITISTLDVKNEFSLHHIQNYPHLFHPRHDGGKEGGNKANWF